MTSTKYKIDRKLQKALNDFPKIIKEQERNFRLREKDIHRFDKLSRELAKFDGQRSANFVRAKQNGKRQVTYWRKDGSSETRIGGDWPWRNQNPGNLAGGRWANQHGAIGKAGNFAVFPSYDIGKAAMFNLLQSPDYKTRTIWDAIPKYAPSTDGNDIENYRKTIKKITGFDLNRKIKDLTKVEFAILVNAFERAEGKYKAGKIVKAAPKKKISGVRKNKKGTIVSYYVDDLGWLSKDRAIQLTQKGQIDAVIAHSSSGSVYLKSRPDNIIENNLDSMG